MIANAFHLKNFNSRPSEGPGDMLMIMTKGTTDANGNIVIDSPFRAGAVVNYIVLANTTPRLMQATTGHSLVNSPLNNKTVLYISAESANVTLTPTATTDNINGLAVTDANGITASQSVTIMLFGLASDLKEGLA